jgi:hypothetical protein
MLKNALAVERHRLGTGTSSALWKSRCKTFTIGKKEIYTRGRLDANLWRFQLLWRYVAAIST